MDWGLWLSDCHQFAVKDRQEIYYHWESRKGIGVKLESIEDGLPDMKRQAFIVVDKI